MSAAARQRQLERIRRAAGPREIETTDESGVKIIRRQTQEEAGAEAVALYQALHASAADVLATAKEFFGLDELRLVRQRGRSFLIMPSVTAQGMKAWHTIGSGATAVEAYAMARVTAENHQREAEAKKAAKPAASPALAALAPKPESQPA